MLYHLAAALIRRQLLKPTLLAIEHTNASGAVHLVTTKDKEIAIQILHVDGEMRGALGSVDHHGDIVLMGNGDHLLHRIDRAHTLLTCMTLTIRVFSLNKPL